jgi:RNA polymerase sigma factor (TIGR02999 family)
MADVTQLLQAIEEGDPAASRYCRWFAELRKAAPTGAREAARRLADGRSTRRKAIWGQESVARGQESEKWDSRGHFFAAAAEAMRRILVEQARRKGRHKRGGGLKRIDLDQVDLAIGVPADEILALDEALARLEAEDPLAARLVKLRFFAGLSLTQAAAAVGISRTSAYEQWAYARAWLRCAIEGDAPASPE